MFRSVQRTRFSSMGLAAVLTIVIMFSTACSRPVLVSAPEATPAIVETTVTEAPAESTFPGTPMPKKPNEGGVLIASNGVISATLVTYPADQVLAFLDMTSFRAQFSDQTAGRILFALQETSPESEVYKLYTSEVSLGEATDAWHGYEQYGDGTGDSGTNVLLGPGNAIEQTVEINLDPALDKTLGDSFWQLTNLGADMSLIRRMVIQLQDGDAPQTVLVVTECLEGMDCNSSPSGHDRFCSWCDSCGSDWCQPCNNFCP